MTNDQRPRSLLAVWLIVGAVLLPVGYVFSTGPLLVLVHAGYLSGESFMLIYWPLVWLYNHWHPVQVFFDWYFGLWGIR